MLGSAKHVLLSITALSFSNADGRTVAIFQQSNATPSVEEGIVVMAVLDPLLLLCCSAFVHIGLAKTDNELVFLYIILSSVSLLAKTS